MKTTALICAAVWFASPAMAQAVVIQITPEDPAARTIICSAVLIDGQAEFKRAWGSNTMFDSMTRQATATDLLNFAALASSFADGTIPAVAGPIPPQTPAPSVSVSHQPVIDTEFGLQTAIMPGRDVPAVVIPLFADVFDGDCLDAGLD